jgi:type IV secretory pathway TraG/TraD family ATPase VirD4
MRKKKRPLMQWVHDANSVIALYNTLVPPESAKVEPPPPPDPMDGLAMGEELQRYALKDGSFFLGRIHEDHRAQFPAGVSDDRHVFIVAGSRSGKGVSFGIPNALLWRGPLFVIDPKGEAASIAGLRRASLAAAQGTATSVRDFVGQEVAILDPLGQVRGPARAFRLTYNPLADIDLSAGGGVRAIHAAADALIHTETGVGAHFSETAETVVSGVIEAILVKEPREKKTLLRMREVLLQGFEELLLYLCAIDTRAGLAREAAAIMGEAGPNEWGSIRTTLSRSLKWLAQPDMQAHLAASNFSLRRAVQEGWSVFVALPPAEIPAFKSWLRLIVRIAIDAKIAMGLHKGGPQTLFLLDEFPTLGRFKVIEESAGYMAGYGMKLVPIIQNIGQVKELYARNWETFLGNAGAIVAFGLNDHETERYVADRLGRALINEAAQSFSSGASGQSIGGSMNAGASWNMSRHERPIRLPNEVHAQGAREQMRAFVIPASGRGFTVRRKSYFDLPKGLFDSPEFIARWESQHASYFSGS